MYTAAFTYYYDPAILRNKLTFFNFQRPSSKKERFQKNNCSLYVFYRVYINIQKLYGLLVYSFMDFLGFSVACVRFWNQNSVKFWLSQSVHRNVEKVSLFLHSTLIASVPDLCILLTLLSYRDTRERCGGALSIERRKSIFYV